MPVKRKSSPSVKVSPRRMVPWFGMPMMSPGPGFVGRAAVARHEGDGVIDRQRLAAVALLDLHAALELARADAQEGDPVAVLGVHVGLDLEHETGEFRLVRLTLRDTAGRAIGAGDRSTTASSRLCTPKLLTAEPKKTGDCLPAR